LDLTDRTNSDGPEDGLLSAALDPEFSDHPFLYVFYTTPDESNEYGTLTRLARFPIIDGVAAPEEELIILEIPQVNPDDYHYGGAIRFGPDGMLYLGIGDGHFYTSAQDLGSLFGKIIRIDVRGASAEQPYKAPGDNPFVGTPDARPEVWAYGMRNPWRMAFDPRDGRLWVGDVGGDLQEEINIVTAGANLGWPILEGTACFWVNPCDELEGATPPIVTYDQTRQRCAVIGGVVYRGSAIPRLDGVYLFADFCGGRVWALDHDADTGWRMIEIADLPLPVSSFGTDAAGNVYVLTFGGPILRLVEADSGFATPPVSVAPSETFTPPATPISGADEAG
ncbi:MAG: PQQ-dependent sugar dehydrogenase, partial [Chloroflexi bacterium]|nr:PQQ-dependent sugar dehydrogenase [Chloroflexota bacterium]MCY3938935.1 PQQ-dependent sugar dehydrogenase [Chloroflexota bacterium]